MTTATPQPAQHFPAMSSTATGKSKILAPLKYTLLERDALVQLRSFSLPTTVSRTVPHSARAPSQKLARKVQVMNSVGEPCAVVNPPSWPNIETLCFSVIIFQGAYSFATRNFCHGPGTQIAFERKQHKTYHRVLVSGAGFGVVAWLASNRYASDSVIVLVPWVAITLYLIVRILLTDVNQAIEMGHVIATYTEPDPATRFRSAMNGAVSSTLLILQTVYSCNSTKYTASSVFRAVGVSISLSLLICFLSVPRQSDAFCAGRQVDRQHTGSLLELITFSWPRKILCPQNLRTLKAKDLPALHPALRAQNLSQQYAQISRQMPHSLSVILVKCYIGPVLLQWSLAILKSFVMLTPELITYRLLHWLSTEQERSAWHGIGLALLLGLSKISELLVDLWLKWITSSKIQLPIHATLSSLVYQKAMRLPSATDAIDGRSSEKPALAQMRIYR